MNDTDKSELEKMLQFDKNSLASSIAWGRNHGKTAGEVADSIWPQFQTLITQQCNQARLNERKIVSVEAKDELEKIRETKALTPDGINGYWSCIRDMSIGEGDRYIELAQAKETEETHG